VELGRERAESSDGALGGAAEAGPELVDAHSQAARAKRRWQPERIAVEAVEREQGVVAQCASPEGFELHVVADGGRAARAHPAALLAQAQGDGADGAERRGEDLGERRKRRLARAVRGQGTEFFRGVALQLVDDVGGHVRRAGELAVCVGQVPRLRRIRPNQPSDERANATSLLIGKQKPIWGGVFTRFEDIDKNTFALVSFDEMTQGVEAQRRAEAERLEFERRASHELAIAKQVQARLFPQNFPPLRTLDYSGVCIQARQVGGDYYDFLHLGDERIGFVLGDIAGKGIAAALLMANLQANLRSQCTVTWREPEQLLRSVNQLFFENTADDAYATLFFAEYDDQTRRIRYVNCGHLPALVLHGNDSVERLNSTCTVIGLFKEWDCSIGECSLLAGDTIAFYTDGITEAFNSSGEEFGEQRLTETLRRHRKLSSQDLLSAIVDEVQKFSPDEQNDDITLIVGKCNE